MAKTKTANDKAYRKAADELFMAKYRGQRCEVCGVGSRGILKWI